MPPRAVLFDLSRNYVPAAALSDLESSLGLPPSWVSVALASQGDASVLALLERGEVDAALASPLLEYELNNVPAVRAAYVAHTARTGTGAVPPPTWRPPRIDPDVVLRLLLRPPTLPQGLIRAVRRLRDAGVVVGVVGNAPPLPIGPHTHTHTHTHTHNTQQHAPSPAHAVAAHAAMAAQKAAQLHREFDVHLLSYELGCRLPHARFYDAVLDTLAADHGVSPAQIVYLDLHGSHLSYAREAGMHTLLAADLPAALRRLETFLPAPPTLNLPPSTFDYPPRL